MYIVSIHCGMNIKAKNELAYPFDKGKADLFERVVGLFISVSEIAIYGMPQ